MGDTIYTDIHTMPQWRSINMVVALSHSPLGYGHNRWEVVISVLCWYFYTCSRSRKHTSWLYLAFLVSKAKGLKFKTQVSRLLCFMSFFFLPRNLCKILWGPYFILKYAPISATAGRPSQALLCNIVMLGDSWAPGLLNLDVSCSNDR